ncbi:MAG: glutaredoxin family protein [Planctomycetaceae bacterium]|nr:glutaredoxin family protein [Planctomycetaceae bacterium]
MSSQDQPSRLQLVGSLALFAGIAVWVMILLDTAVELPINLPASWYQQRPLWGVAGLALFAFGWRLQRHRGLDTDVWNPGPAGRRFRRLIVYSRPDCHLCDDAKAVLAGYLDYLPEIEEIDIDTRPELQERFGTWIPVVELDGVIRFRGRVDELLLRRLIEGSALLSAASPVSDPDDPEGETHDHRG